MMKRLTSANDAAARQFFQTIHWIDLRQYIWLSKIAWFAWIAALLVVLQARRRTCRS